MSKSINTKYLKYSKRPLIATSLAIALGVSVVSGVDHYGSGVLTGTEYTIKTKMLSAAQSDFPQSDVDALLFIKGGGDGMKIILEGDLIGRDISETGEVYGIYIHPSQRGKVSFVSDSFRKFIFNGIISSDKTCANNYIFKNTSSNAEIFIQNIGIASAIQLSSSIKTFGLYNAIKDAIYNFGQGGVTFSPITGIGEGDHTLGIVLEKAFSTYGDITFQKISSMQGGAGANAGTSIGIVSLSPSQASKDYIRFYANGNIVFDEIKGGDAGLSGRGGDAIGIYAGDEMGITADSHTIQFKSLVYGAGDTSTGNNAHGDIFVVKNASNGKTLSLNHVFILSGETNINFNSQENVFAFYNSILNASYDFGGGSSSNANTGTIATIDYTSKTDGKNVYGVILEKDTNFSGNLSFEKLIASKGGGGYKNGGSVFALTSFSSTASLRLNDNSVITFKNIGAGSGEDGTDGAGGNISGIFLKNNNSLNISGSGKIVFKNFIQGQGGNGTPNGNDGKIYIINNASNQTLAIDGISLVVGSSTANENIGIDHVLDVGDYVFGGNEAKTSISIGSNTSQDATGNGIGAIGFKISNNVNVGGNLEFASIIGGEGSNGQVSGKATGMLVAQDAEIMFEDAEIVFDHIDAGGDANGSGLVIDTGMTANMYGNAKLVFKSFEAPITTYKRGARTSGENFMLDNQGKLNIKNNTSIIASSDGSYSAEGVYGIYNAVDSSYKFGTLNFEALSASGDVAGIVLSSKLTHLSGSLTQNITAGNTQDSSGVGIAFEGSAKYDLQGGSLDLTILGENAYGIAVRGSAAVFSGGGNATFKVQGDRSVGILLTSNTAEQTATLTLNGVKSPLLQAGNESSTQEAYMLKLKNGEFYADLSLSGSGSYAKTKDGKAFAIYSEGSSTVSGKIVVEYSGLVGSERFAIKNLGALSLAQNSSITLGSAILTNGEMFGISNSLSDVKFDFGSGNASTTIGKIKSRGTSAKNALGIISSSNLAMSGNLVFSGISAEDGATGAKGGDVYALTATATSAITEQVFDFTNANITFKSISAGLGGNIYALYLDASQNQNLTIRGGKISFENMQDELAGKQGSVGEINGIYNESSSTLKLENISIAIGEAGEASGYGIYNNIQDVKYILGDGIFNDGVEGKTLITSNQEQFTGFIVAENAYASGALEVQGDGRVVGVELRSGKTLQLDSMEFIRVTSGVNKDVYGLKAMDKSTLDLNAAPILKIQANTADTSTTGNAYGVYAMGDFTTLVNSFALELKGEKVYGIYLSEDKQTPHCAEVKASITTNQSGASALQGNEAYAIYNSGTNILSGEIRVGDGTTSAIGNDSGAKAYVLYNNGDLTLDGNIVIQDKALASAQEKAHLYNSGKLIFESDASFSAGNAITQSNLSATDINLDVVMQAGSYAEFRAQKAFDASGGGAVNLTLNGEEQNNTVIIFNGKETQDVENNLGVLKGQYADISIAGSSQDAVLGAGGRYLDESGASKAFYARKLNIADMQLNNSHFILAAKQKNDGSKVADNIYIANSSAGEKLDNTLHIVLDAKANNASRVTLAEVDSNIKDKVVFNGLANGDEEFSSVYKGFTTGLVKIKRDDSSGNAIYSSTLEVSDARINQDFVAPTTVALSTGLSLFNANLNSLSKRMGELKANPYSQGVWTRVFAGEQSIDFGAKQSLVYATFQAGYDYKFDLDGGENYLGVAISYVKGLGGEVAITHKDAPILSTGIISELTSSDSDGVEVALYNSYIDKSGVYSDSIVKFGYFSNKLNMFAQSQTYNTENFAVAVSEEVGYKAVLGENNEWFITPQAELAFGYVGGSEFTQEMFGEKMFSKQDAVMMLRSRVGAAWGYDFSYLAKESNVKASLYLGTYYAYDYFIGGDTTLEAMGINGEYVTLSSNAYEGTGRFVMNLGTSIDVKDSTKIYFDFEKSFGGKIQTDYQVSFGVRFGFGEKISTSRQEEEKTSEATLKPKELQKSE